MAWSTRSKLVGALALSLVVAIACGGDDKGGGSENPPPNGPPPAGIVGKTCATDTDCGSGSTCGQQQTFGTLSALLQLAGLSDDLPAPGGYCTLSCTTDTQCGSDGVCLGAPLGGLGGLLSGECRKSCTTNNDCRAGYECATQAEIPTDAGLPPQAFTYRLPSQCQAKPMPDMLTAGQVGSVCDTQVDGGVAVCGDGYCVGNSCTGACNDDSTCGSGASCISNGFYGTAGTCQQTCGVDSDCKSYKPNGNVGCVDANARKICGAKVFALAPNAAGKACKVDGDCGPTGECATSVGLPPVTAPDGYCTAIACQNDATCGTGGVCLGTVPASACYASCTSDTSCRAGYSCQPRRNIAGDTSNVCAPSATAAPRDAGTPTPVDAGVPAIKDAG